MTAARRRASHPTMSECDKRAGSAGGARPTREDLHLHLAIIRPKDPVGSAVHKEIVHRFKLRDCSVRGRRPERGPKPLVRALMCVDRGEDRRIKRIRGADVGPSVVTERCIDRN